MKRPLTTIAIAGAGAALLCLALPAASAPADVGVHSASRDAGRPGAKVRLRIDCGFCFPPCRGPQGHRHPEGFAKGPCMLNGGKQPPRSFAISLLPLARAEGLLSCEMRHHWRCPHPAAAPHRGLFTLLGAATPPPGGNDPEHGDPPRYLLEFRIPPVPAGEYAYVIWCGVCYPGRGGSLVVYPTDSVWRLRVLPASGWATASATMGQWPRLFASTSTAASTSSG